MPTKLFFFPDYRANNHYQSMLYKEFGSDIQVSSGSLELAFAQLQSEPNDSVIFHLHWPEPIFAGVQNLDDFRLRASNYIERLTLFRNCGGCFIWTIHNVLPHDLRFEQGYIWFHQVLADLCDLVLIHSEVTSKIVNKYYAISAARTLIVPHGSYVDTYPMTAKRSDARRALHFGAGDFVIGFIGQLRPYKGLENLVAAFEHLRRSDTTICLLIAGKSAHPTRPGAWSIKERLTSGLRVVEKFIPATELQIYYAACDVVALPYIDILTSGSAILSLSFGKPVILPRLPATEELERSDAVLTYEARSQRSLVETLAQARNLSQNQLAKLSHNATQYASRFAWSTVSKSLKSELNTLCQQGTETVIFRGKTVHVNRSLQRRPDGIAVLIVDYFSHDDTIKLVRSLPPDVKGRSVTAFVIDNSGDLKNYQRLCRSIPEAYVFSALENLGYAGGNNLLFQMAEDVGSEFVAICNPDLDLRPRLFDLLLDVAKEVPGAILSPVVLKDSGKISFAGAFFIDGIDLEVEHFLEGGDVAVLPKEPYPVDALNGCCMFLSIAIGRSIGPISESFFLYYEETEWFARAQRLGIPCIVVPFAFVEHKKVSHGSSVPTFYYLYYLTRGSALFARLTGNSVSAVLDRKKEAFVAPWRTRLAKHHSHFLPLFDRIILAAVRDGEADVQGRVSIGERAELADGEDHTIVGFVEELDLQSRKIVGWVAAPREDTADLQASVVNSTLGVWICVNDTPMSFVVATKRRQDVAEAGFTELAGFETTLPESVADGVARRLEVWSSVNGRRLPIACQDYVRQTDVVFAPIQPIEANPQIEGRVEGIRNARLVGWVMDTAHPDREVCAEVHISGSVYVIDTANIFREDLRRAGKGNGCHGFELSLRNEHLLADDYNVELRTSGGARIVSRRKISHAPAQHGFSVKFGLSDFLAWGFVEDRMPVGIFQQCSHLTNQMAALKLSAIQKSREYLNTDLISIIMPMFNRESVVIRAIESVMSQTYANWELIVVDDGSDDFSVRTVSEWCEKYKDPRVKLITCAINAGVSSARNIGLAGSQGKYIAYLDSDNVWYPEALALLHSALKQDQTAVCAYAGQEIWEHIQNDELPELRFVRSCRFNRSRIEKRNYVDLNVFMHTRSIYERMGGFNEQLRRLVDWELILRYTSLKAPIFVPSLLSRYFVGAVNNQITRVESYETALSQLRRSQNAIDLPVPINADWSVLVVVYCSSLDGALKWFRLNSGWVHGVKSTIIARCLVDDAQQDVYRTMLASIVDGEEPTWSEMDNVAGLIDKFDYAVMIDAGSFMTSGWMADCNRAMMSDGVLVSTGRRLMVKVGAVAPPAEDLADLMPSLIAKHVIDWKLRSGAHGVSVSELPDGMVVFAAPLIPLFLRYVFQAGCRSLKSSGIYEVISEIYGPVCAYLPQVKVYVEQL